MVGVHDLRDPVEYFDLSRNDTLLTRRQQPLQVIPARMKEHKLKRCRRILHIHPVRASARFGWVVFADRDFDRGDTGCDDLFDAGAPVPVNTRERQRHQHVQRLFDTCTLQNLSRFWPDPRQPGQRSKQ